MKVLHFIETLASGGAERLMITLLPELARQGLDVELAVQRPPLDLQPDLEARGVPVHVLPQRRKWAIPMAARDLAELARRRNVDVIHAHLYFPTVVSAAVRWLNLQKCTTHSTFHNLAYDGANERTWKLEGRRLLAGFLVRRGIDLPQAVSRASADHFKSAYKLRDVAVLPNAIDLSVLDKIDTRHGEALVLPGRLVPEKGHMDLIAALGLMKTTCPPVIFAGGGPLQTKLEDEIRGAGLPIEVTGSLPYSEMLGIIAAARIVVIPSRYEGFGLTALEALALGRAVVASKAGGLPEVLGELGRLVSPSDPAALAAALDAVLANPEWIKKQEAAGPKRAAQFALPNIAARQILLYRDIRSSKNQCR